MVSPLRFFGLKPSRRASFSNSGEGSEEASVAELAGFEAAFVESVLAAVAEGAVADEEGEAVDEVEVVDEVALEAGAAVGGVAEGGGDCAPARTAATRTSEARKAVPWVMQGSPIFG
jgi:hypothetical protein